MTDEEKLYQAYYQSDRLWTGSKAIKELQKIMSIPKKNIKSWVARQVLWQVHIPPPKEIYHPYYDIPKPNEQRQFGVVHMPHDVFEGKTYKCLLSDVDVPLRYGVAKPLTTKKSSEVELVLRAIYKKKGWCVQIFQGPPN